MRVMMGNMMGMGTKPEGQEEKLHTLAKVLGVDVMGVADTKVWWEREGAGRRVGGLHERVVMGKHKRGWAGSGAIAAWAPGLAGVGGDTVGGSAMLVAEGWAGRNVGQMVDSRGWGRWAGMRLHGKGGWGVVVIVVYMPCRPRGVTSEGSMWQSQLDRMQKEGLGDDPCVLLRSDLMRVVNEERARKSQVVMVGDWNMPVRRPSEGGVVRKEWDEWHEGMKKGMVGPRVELG
jgi:hypothetical protein